MSPSRPASPRDPAGGPRVPSLSGVQETLLIPLASRVAESTRPDATFRDPEAERIAALLDVDLGFFAGEWTNVETVVGRTHILDRGVQAWMADHPGGQVFNLGAGLCTRFHRLDDGRVRWTDVDLPDVAALRRELVREGPRVQLVAASVLDPTWLERVEARPALFLAEGLLMYLAEDEVMALLSRLMARAPGSEMWLEAISPLLLRLFGRRSRAVNATGATFQWGLREAAELESRVPGVRVLAVAHPNEVLPERWRWLRVFRYVRPIHTGLKCVHLRLGEG